MRGRYGKENGGGSRSWIESCVVECGSFFFTLSFGWVEGTDLSQHDVVLVMRHGIPSVDAVPRCLEVSFLFSMLYAPFFKRIVVDGHASRLPYALYVLLECFRFSRRSRYRIRI